MDIEPLQKDEWSELPALSKRTRKNAVSIMEGGRLSIADEGDYDKIDPDPEKHPCKKP